MSARERYASEGQYKTAPSSPRRDDPSPQTSTSKKTVTKNVIPSSTGKGGLSNFFSNIASGAQNIYSQLPSVFNRRANYNLSLNIPGQRKRIEEYRRDYADYLRDMGSKPPPTLSDPDLFNFFEKDAFSFNPPSVKMGDQVVQPLNYGDYLATFKGSPGIKYSGDVGNLQRRAVYDQFGNKTFEYDQINEQSPQGLQLLMAQQQMNQNNMGIGSLYGAPQFINGQFIYGLPMGMRG